MLLCNNAVLMFTLQHTLHHVLSQHTLHHVLSFCSGQGNGCAVPCEPANWLGDQPTVN